MQFWSDNWDTLIFQSAELGAATYTPALAVWKDQIIGGKDKNGKYPRNLNVVIKGTGTNAPVTGPYKSCKITLPVDPSIKATPAASALASIPPAPACAGLFPSNVNQFVFEGIRLKPSTAYALRFSDPPRGYPDVPMGSATSDADGAVTKTSASRSCPPSARGR